MSAVYLFFNKESPRLLVADPCHGSRLARDYLILHGIELTIERMEYDSENVSVLLDDLADRLGRMPVAGDRRKRAESFSCGVARAEFLSIIHHIPLKTYLERVNG